MTEPLNHSSEHRRGPAQAGATVVEYFDYQCPYCASAREPIRHVLKSYEHDAALVVRHFPLTEVHEWAAAAALASEAAANQGRFWEMHELLFGHREELDLDLIVDLADELGLDRGKFVADLESPDVISRVNRDIAEGEHDGVDGTPTLFVNGVRLEGEVSIASLTRAIVTALRSKAA